MACHYSGLCGTARRDGVLLSPRSDPAGCLLRFQMQCSQSIELWPAGIAAHVDQF